MKQRDAAIAEGDGAREALLRIEMDAITAVIRDDPDVARSSRAGERRQIVAAINRSLEKIRKYDPVLARTLADALKMTKFISYSPESADSSVNPVDSGSKSAKKPPRPR